MDGLYMGAVILWRLLHGCRYFLEDFYVCLGTRARCRGILSLLLTSAFPREICKTT